MSLDADFGLHEGEGLQPPDGLCQPPTLPPPSAAAPDVVRDKPPLRIVGRSRVGRAIRLPAKLLTTVAEPLGGSPVAA